MSLPSENVRSFELDKSPSKLSFNDSFHFKPDYESPLPNYQELQSYLEDALRKQISLQYLLGIHKVHDIYQEKTHGIQAQRHFFQLLIQPASKNLDENQKNNQREVMLLKEHLNEELMRLKAKQQELDLFREELSMEPWGCLKDPNKLYERLVLKQDELWADFQKNHDNSQFNYPKQEKLWAFLSQNTTEINSFRETLYQYQEFVMQEHVKLDLLKQRLLEDGEKLKKEQNSFEREKVNQLDYEVFEETKEKIKDELNNEKQKLDLERRKMNVLLNIVRNYMNYKEDRALDWDTSLEDFIQEIFGQINNENDVFEKNLKKKQQLKRLKDDIQRLMDEEITVDPYENIAGLLGNIVSHKESSQEDEIQRKLFKRKEEMLQHKQKELEALKKLLEKESSILQEEKMWLVNEKNKLVEGTKKKIEILKDENQKLREENQLLKEQNPLQNISNIIPSNSNKTIKATAMMRPDSVTQLKGCDDFQITEQFIANPQIRKIALFTLANWLDFSIETNITKPYVMKILGFYKWKIHTNIRDLPVNEDYGQISIEDNTFLKKKWLAYQKSLISQKRCPYNSLNKQRKALEESFFDFERRKFFKNRFVQLFGSIFRHRRRKEKLIYVIGFYKFCLKSLLHGLGSRSQGSISEKRSFNAPPEDKKTYASISNYVSESPKKQEKTKKGHIIKEQNNNLNNKNYHDSIKEAKDIKLKKHYEEANNNLSKNHHDSIKESKDFKQNQHYEEFKSERMFAVPLQQESHIPIKEKSNRNSLEEIQRPEIINKGSFEEIQKPNILDVNKKMKGALIISVILIRRSMKNSSMNKKANAWIKWMKWILIQEREFMNNEFNDLNILLSEMVCRENQRIMNLRLKKNDMDSRINVLAQMLTCMKVNIFQKNIKKIKVV